MKISCCCFVLLLAVIPYLVLAEDETTCPSAISSDCKCYENSESRLRIKCSETTLTTVKSALIADSIHTDVWKLEFIQGEDTVLSKDFFKEFTSLTEFDNAFGAVTTIEPGAFNGATTMENINLRYNELTWLSGDMFDGLTSSMEEIDLANNDLEYLYSGLEDVFLKVSTKIKLSSNALKCTCQIQWLVNLLQSDKSIPDFDGATCTDSNSNTHSMETTTTLFDCGDICTDGFHNCKGNETCLLDTVTQSFLCTNDSSTSSSPVLPSPSPSPSPSAVEPAITSTVIPLYITSSAVTEFTTSSYIVELSTSFDQAVSSKLTSVIEDYSTLITLSSVDHYISPSPMISSLMQTNNSVTATSQSSQQPVATSTQSSQSSIPMSSSDTPSLFPSFPPPSPSPSSITVIPEECGSSYCDGTTQSCIMACQCPFCSCNDGLTWSDSNQCTLLSNDQVVCANDGLFGLSWPTVAGGSTITIPCCSTTDTCSTQATRTCSVTGEWTNLISNGCISTSVYAIQNLLNKVINGEEGAIANLTSSLVSESSNQDLMQEDLVQLSNMVTQTVNQLDSSNVNTQVITDIVQTVSNLLDEEHTDAWQEEESISTIIAQLFVSVETLGTLLPVTNGTATFKTNNLALQVIVPDGSESGGWNISSSLLNGTSLQGQSSIHIPGTLVMDALGGQDLKGCDVRVVASLWDVSPSFFNVNSSAAVVDEPPLVHGMCKWSDDSMIDSSTLFVNSLVISASLYSSNCSLNTSNLSKPIQITLHHVNQTLENPTCSFLEPTEDSDGDDWANEGCRVSSLSNSNQTVCECFHLTSFALLMSPTGSVSISQPLIIATKIGLSISILALVITCILLFCLKLESKLNIVHRQLALSLCLSQFVFLVGVDRVSIPYPDAACTAIAALLHYLLLCTFSWELIEGIHLYLFIVKVFYNKKIIWSYFPLAWGVPLIIVAVTLGLNFCEYGSQNFCWITTGQGTNWAFHGPVLVVIAVNIVMLVIISGVVIRSVRRKDPESCGLCKLLQASFILVPTLGLTWVLGFFVVGENDFALVVEWIFFILTTLQGLLIFTIHCVLNTEVRASFLKTLGFKKAARKQKSVFALRPVAALNSMAASGFRRLSGAGRRGSLEPLASEDGGGPPGLLTAQEIRDLQARVGLQLGTVDEEDGDEEQPEIETELITDGRSEIHYQIGNSNENLCKDDDISDDVVSSTHLLLNTSPLVSTIDTAQKQQNGGMKPDIHPGLVDTQEVKHGSNTMLYVNIARRSSTDGLLDEEKHGVYQFDEITTDNDRVDPASHNQEKATVEGEVVNSNTELELVEFSLGIDTTIPSSISLIPEDTSTLKARSYSCIEEERRRSMINPSPDITRRSESTSRLNGTHDQTNLVTSNKSTSLMTSRASSIVMMDINPTDNMEELLIEHTKSSEDILNDELNDTSSHASLLY